MLNLFLSYKCNLSCTYCFAGGLQHEFPEPLSRENFSRLRQWLGDHAVPAIALLGGEPTLHPRIGEIAAALNGDGIMAVLFTNGLFPENLRPVLAQNVTNFVINYNDPTTYLPNQWALLQDNLRYLTEQHCRVSFSKNFARQYRRYDYILKACREFGINHVRYDITRPNPNKYNGHYGLGDTQEVLETVLAFVRECDALEIKTGLDCCIPMCDLKPEDREYLKRVSMKFSGVCHPSIDIHPDLSASYCLPMRGVTVDDITQYSGERGLFQYFAAAVQEVRYGRPASECQACPEFRFRCQGGCLALKTQGAQELAKGRVV